VRPELQNLPEPNWFHHGVQILDLLDLHQPKVCVELGSNRGCSAIATARLIRQWGGRLTCVDVWRGTGQGEVTLDTFVANITAAGVADVIDFMQMDTVAAAGQWVRPIDYLYVDAGHTSAECMADLEAWWPFLNSGGLFFGDDYDDPHGFSTHGVTKAWDDFEEAHGLLLHRTLSSELLGCQCEKCQAGRLVWGIKP